MRKLNNSIDIFKKYTLFKIGYYRMSIDKTRDPYFILAYHGITDKIRNPVIDKWAVTAKELSEHIEFLQKDFEIVTLDTLLELVKNNKKLNKPCLVITFDDGFENIYLNAYPLLRGKKIPFLVAFPSGLLGTSRTIWTVELDIITQLSSLGEIFIPSANGLPDIVFPLRNKEERIRASIEIRRIAMPVGGDYCCKIADSLIEQYGFDNYNNLIDEYPYFKMMSVPQAQEMVLNGVEPAVHGRFHLPLNNADDSTLKNEIVESRRELSEKLGVKDIGHFCLCHGASSVKAIELIKQTGYKSCLTSEKPGRVKYGDDMYELKRFESNKNILNLVSLLAKE
ncbi:MAG: polysaccharide deacetylase family protein [bacterium]